MKIVKKPIVRTWCFWTKETSIWEPIISKKWDVAYVLLMKNFKRDLELQPYQYNRVLD
jgi:lycopene beta-cyclase